MKQKLEKATHKAFGWLIALITIPAAIIFVILWITLGLGSRATSLFVRKKL